MVLSRKGAIFIGRFEGWVPILYNDLGDAAHIGFGHKIHDGPFTDADVHEWNPPISKQQGLQLLERDAESAAEEIRQLVRVPLRQCQFDALVSFTYNLGTGTFADSGIAAALNRGDSKSARKTMLRYDHVGTVRYPGLTKRRRAEARLFRSGLYFLNSI